jgi:hypothetical protein
MLEVEKFSFLPKTVGHFRKILMLEIFWHFEIFFLHYDLWHLIKVEEIFHICQKNFGHFGNILELNFFRAV